MADINKMQAGGAPGQSPAPQTSYDSSQELGTAQYTPSPLGDVPAPLSDKDLGIAGKGRKPDAFEQANIDAVREMRGSFLETPTYTNLGQVEQFLAKDYTFNPLNSDPETDAAHRQGWMRQWVNREVKMKMKGLGSFITTIMATPNTLNALADGSFSELHDNFSNNIAQDLIEWSDKEFPNFENRWERSHPFLNLIPLSGFFTGGSSANSWGKVWENLGFTVGTLAATVGEDIAIGYMTGATGELPLLASQINKGIYRLSKYLNKTDDVGQAIKQVVTHADDLTKGLKAMDIVNRVGRNTLWTAQMIKSSFAEAAFESLESQRSLLKEFKDNFILENGRVPNAEEQGQMEDASRSAGNTRFALNVALLSATNSIQWGGLLRPFNAMKGAIEAEVNAGTRLAIDAANIDKIVTGIPKAKMAKGLLSVANSRLGRILGESLPESFEEGSQFMIQKGVDGYYTRKYNKEAITDVNNFVKSFGEGINATFGTQEGWENIVQGLLGGAMFKTVEHGYRRLNGIKTPDYKSHVDAAAAAMSKMSVTGIFNNKIDEAVEAKSINNDLLDSVRAGNVFLYKNFQHEHFFNFIKSGLKQNKFDLRMLQLTELSKLTGEEFSKEFGLPYNEDTSSHVGEYINRLKTEAKYIKEVYDRVNRTFVNPFKYHSTITKNKVEQQLYENSQHKVYDETKDMLVYTMSTARDSKNRIERLRSKLSDGIINVDELVKVTSPKGAKELLTQWEQKIKDLETSYNNSKDPLTKSEKIWYEARVTQIHDSLENSSQEKKDKSFTNLVLSMLDKYNSDYAKSLGIAAEPFDRLKLTEITQIAKDMGYLQLRDKVAVDSYAKLITKGGFGAKFEEIKKVRAEAADLEIPIVEESPIDEVKEPTPPPTPKPPQEEELAHVADTQKGFADLSEKQKTGVYQMLVDAVDGKGSKVSDEELTFLEVYGLIESPLSFVDKKLKEKDYTKIESAEGQSWWIKNTKLKEMRDLLSPKKPKKAEEKPAPVKEEKGPTPPAPPTPPVQENKGKAKGPFWIENFINKLFTPPDLKLAFNDAIFSGVKQRVKQGLSVSISHLEGEYAKAYRNWVDKGRQAKPMTANGFNLISSSPAHLNFSLKHNGKEIGKLAFPDRLLFKYSGEWVTIDKITPEFFAYATNIKAAEHAKYVNLYYKQLAFKNLITKRFEDAGEVPVTIESDELQDMISNIEITYGSLDLIERGTPRPLLKDLKHKYVHVKDDKGQIHAVYVIAALKKTWNADVGRMQRSTPPEIIRDQRAIDLGLDMAPIAKKLYDYRTELWKTASRYVLVVEMPDGQYRYVAMRPDNHPDPDGVFQRLKARAEETVKRNFIQGTETNYDGVFLVGEREVYYKYRSEEEQRQMLAENGEEINSKTLNPRTFNDEFNKALSDELFISDPGTPDPNEPNKKLEYLPKLYFDFAVSPIGAIRLELYDPATQDQIVLVLPPQVLVTMDSLEDMLEYFPKAFERAKARMSEKANAGEQLAQINYAIFSKFNLNIKRENFKKSSGGTAEKITAQDVEDKLSAATTTEVFKDGTMRFDVNEAAVQAAYVPIEEKVAPVEPAVMPSAEIVATPVVTEPKETPPIIEAVNLSDEEIAKAMRNQEEISSIVYDSIDDAFAAQGIRYTREADGTYKFYNAVTGDELPFAGYTPAEVANQLHLQIKQDEQGEEEAPFMLSQSPADLNRIINIEIAKQYIKQHLPEFIRVEDIDAIMDKVAVQGYVWGAFSDAVIYLSKQAEKGTEYHEAFHAIFRMLLSEKDISNYLSRGQASLYKDLKKENKSIASFLKERRALGLYKNFTDEQAYDRLYEEHIADLFVQWNNDKIESGFFSKLFTKITDFFKWLLSSRRDLDFLFRNIDKGVYRYSNIAANRFTSNKEESTLPEIAFVLIPARPGVIEVTKDKPTIVDRRLDPIKSKRIIQTVAAYFIDYSGRKENIDLFRAALLDKVLDDFRNLYSPSNLRYASESEEFKRRLERSDMSYIFANPESREIIKNEAIKYIETIGYIDQFKEEEEGGDEVDKYLAATDEGEAVTAGFDESKENVGGFESLPTRLRKYIGFTTYPVTDEFGNSWFITPDEAKAEKGIPLFATIDAVTVYYALLRALANVADPITFFKKMIRYADGNTETQHFVSKFLIDTGLDVDLLFNENKLEASKNPALVEMVRNGFFKYKMDYIFTELGTNTKSKEKTTRTYSANRRDVDEVQLAQWSGNYNNEFLSLPESIQEDRLNAIDAVREKYFHPLEKPKSIDAQYVANAAKEIQEALRGIGIYVAIDFARYSYLTYNAKRFDDLNETYKKQGAPLSPDDPANVYISRDDYDYVQVMKIPDQNAINFAFLSQLTSTARGANPYYKDVKPVETVVEESDETEAAAVAYESDTSSRILHVAAGNAYFDETVGESSYTNANKQVVFAHQDGTYNTKMGYKLRDASYRAQLREQGFREDSTRDIDAYDFEMLTKNFLLTSESFENIADTLMIRRIDGLRETATNSLGAIITGEFRDQADGITYGDYSSREFIASLFNMYVSYKQDQLGKDGSKVVTAPHLVRVLEASKTGDTVNLPVNMGVYKKGVTQKTITIVYEELLKEWRRISRVTDEIGTITENVVENYHTGRFEADGYTVKGNNYRGLQFTDNMASLLTPVTNKQLEALARSKDSSGRVIPEQLEKKVKEEIAQSLNTLVKDTLDVLIREGVIRKTSQGHYINEFLDSRYFTGEDSLGLIKSIHEQQQQMIALPENIGHVVINDFINTLAYNQILHGDHALSFKNDGGIDPVKRAKGDNAAIVSMRADLIDPSLGIFTPFTHSNVAIFKEIEELLSSAKPGEKKTKIADAQMYATVDGLRKTFWGLGKLTPRIARFFDAIENGKDIHNIEEINEDGIIIGTYDGVFDEEKGLIANNGMTNSLKLVYRDAKTYFKMSVVVLQPSLTSYKNTKGEWKPFPGSETLHNLRIKMEKEGIDFAAPESASKAMTLDVAKDTKTFSDLKGHLFDNQFFGLQTANPSNKLEITTPTQLLQIIDSEQDDETPVLISGKWSTVKAVKEAYQTFVSQKIQNAYDVTKQEIYAVKDFNKDIEQSIADGEVTPRLATFQRRAVENLERTGADAQLLEFFSVDASGAPRYNLNMNSTKVKFHQLYLSYFSKGILSQKSPGYTVSLFSGMDTKILKRAKRILRNVDEAAVAEAMSQLNDAVKREDFQLAVNLQAKIERLRKIGQVVEWEIVRRAAIESNIDNVQNAKYHGSIDDVTNEGELFVDELRYNVEEYDEDGHPTGKFYSEMMLPAHFQELLQLHPSDPIPEAIAKGIGARIPSQDKHSFMSLRIVDFLPANLGSTGMFPKELIRLSGADFDLDKEYIARYDSYIIKRQDGAPIFRKYGDATTNEGKWSEYRRWMYNNNKTVKGLIKDRLANDVEYQRLKGSEWFNFFDLDELVAGGKSDKRRREIEQNYLLSVFKELHLPSTLEEFIEKSKDGELNNGVLNNRILDAMVSLLTNDGIREIANTPASLTYLDELGDSEDFKDKNGNKLFDTKSKYPVDSTIGKYFAFKNNTTGKKNIGIAVRGNLIYSLLNKADKLLAHLRKSARGFEIDEHKFDSFAGNNEYNPKTGKFDGRRTNDVNSTMISAATDEAKEQKNAQFNIGQDALKVLMYLNGLKVPLRTTIAFINQPIIQQYLKIKSTRNNALRTEDEKRLTKDHYKTKALEDFDASHKDYDKMSDDEIVAKLESLGMLEINCD